MTPTAKEIAAAAERRELLKNASLTPISFINIMGAEGHPLDLKTAFCRALLRGKKLSVFLDEFYHYIANKGAENG